MKCIVFFVSEDSGIANDLVAALGARGIDMRAVDVSDPMHDGAFDDVNAGLVVLSAASFDAPDMARRVGEADHAGLDLYTVRSGEAPLTSNLGFFLKWSQWLDLESSMAGEDLDFLAQTIRSGKGLDRAQQPSRRRARQRLWGRALGGDWLSSLP